MRVRHALKLSLILIGLYQFMIAFSGLLSAIGMAASSLSLFSEYFLGYFGTPLIFLILGSFLIYRADWIIDQLRLDQNFLDSELTIDHHHFEMLLKGGIILLSLSLIVNNLPAILLSTFEFLREKVDPKTLRPMVTGRLEVNALLRLLIGSVMLFNSGRLSRWTIKYNHLNEDE